MIYKEDHKGITRRQILGYSSLAVGVATAGSIIPSWASNDFNTSDQSIRDFIDQMYQAIWFDKGGWINNEKLRSLMHPGATFAWAEKDGFRLIGIDEFLDLFGAGFKKDGIYALHERSLNMKSLVFGDVAQVFDTYEAIFNEGDFSVRGVNIYQLIRQNGKWKCASLAWHEETTDHPLPTSERSQND